MKNKFSFFVLFVIVFSLISCKVTLNKQFWSLPAPVIEHSGYSLLSNQMRISVSNPEKSTQYQWRMTASALDGNKIDLDASSYSQENNGQTLIYQPEYRNYSITVSCVAKQDGYNSAESESESFEFRRQNLAFWLDSSNTESLVSNSSSNTVSIIRDLSGNSRDAFSESAFEEPYQYTDSLSGNQVIQFKSENGLSSNFRSQETFTLFAVFRHQSKSTDASGPLWQFYEDEADYFNFYPSSSGRTMLSADSSNNQKISAATLFAKNEWSLASITYGQDSVSLIINGVENSKKQINTKDINSGDLLIGYGYDSEGTERFFDGDLGEIIIFNADLDDENIAPNQTSSRELIEEKLLEKWAITADTDQTSAAEINVFAEIGESVSEVQDSSLFTFPLLAETESSKTINFKLYNVGSKDISSLNVFLSEDSSDAFSQNNSSLASELAAGEETSFSLTFTAPADDTEYNAVCHIEADEIKYSFNVSAQKQASPEAGIQVLTGDFTKINNDNSPPFNFGIGEQDSFKGEFIFRIRNSGAADLNINSLVLSDTDNYSLTSPSQTTLASLQETVFAIGFLPRSIGDFPLTVTINSNAGNISSFTLNLTGSCSGVPEPDIVIRRGSTIYDSNDVYQMGEINILDAKTVTFEIRNQGTKSLTLSGLTLSLTTHFSWDEGISFPLVVEAENSAFFELTYSPQSIGPHSCEVSLSNDDPDTNLYTFNLAGTGTAPEILVELDSIEYSDGGIRYDYGISDLSKDWTITNEGNAALTINSINIVGGNGHFTLDMSATTLNLNPAESTTFSVSFTNGSGTKQEAEIIINNNDTTDNEDIYTIPLVGGGSELELSLLNPEILPFRINDLAWNYGYSTTQLSNTIQIQNDQDYEIVIDNIVINNTRSSDFSKNTDSLDSSLLPAESSGFDVIFTPQTDTSADAEITISCTKGRTLKFMVLASSVFQPDAIVGNTYEDKQEKLKFWLDANSIQSLEEYDEIALWPEKIQEMDPVQANAEARPRYIFPESGINGHPTVLFTGDDYLRVEKTFGTANYIIEESLDGTTSSRSFFIVYRNSEFFNSYDTPFCASYDSNGDLDAYPWFWTPVNSDFYWRVYNYQNRYGQSSSGSVILENPQLLSSTMYDSDISSGVDNSPNEIWINGIYDVASGNNTERTQPVKTVYVGVRAVDRNRTDQRSHYHGEIAEVLIYNFELNDTQRQQVEFYLNEKYNIY